MDSLTRLFTESGFMPHGHCYLWKTSLVWMMVTSDTAIGIAYTSISLTLYYLVKRLKLPFSAVFLAFGLFIGACGATHFMEVWTLWNPLYWLSATVKAITAIASAVTAVWLFPISKKVISFVSRVEEAKTQESRLKEQDKRLATTYEELRQSEESFRLLVEGVRDYMICKLDPDGRVMTWNKGGEKIKGYQRDEVIGKSISIFYPPEEIAKGCPERNLKEAATHGYIEDENWRLRKDGSRFWADTVLTALYDQEGKLEGFLKITRDITERKKKEDLLIQSQSVLSQQIEHQLNILTKSEAKYQHIIETANEGIWVMDQDGKTNFVNRKMAQMLVSEVQDLQSSMIYDFLKPEGVSVIQEAFKSGKNGFSQQKELIFLTREKKEIWAILNLSPFLDKDGKFQGMLGMVTDITLRKKAEQAMKRSEERFRKIVDSNHDGILIVDRDEIVRFANPTTFHFFGKPPEELVGQKLPFQIRDQPSWEMDIERVDRSKTPTEIMLGELEWEGKEVYYLLLHDVLAQKRVQSEMEEAKRAALQASQLKSSFLANMSHEIRTPLNVIVGIGNLLAETQLGAEQKDYVSTVNKASNALLGLINDILDLSKVEAGQLDLEVVDFGIYEVVQSVISIINVRAREKNLSILIRIDQSVPKFLRGDPMRLTQVLLNLIGNSIKFTSVGSISLSAKARMDGLDDVLVFFQVEDTGIGIPKDKLETIFDRFTQADASTTRRFGGTGLGLAITQKIIELMNGHIQVTSEVGVGSTFGFDIPFKKSLKVESTYDEQKNPVAKVDKRALRILIAEDYEENQKVILALLKKTPYRVTLVSDGKQAVDIFEKQIFDLILMDMQMPVMDGYEAVRTIRAFEKKTSRPRLPIIAFTANAVRQEIQRSFDAGCDGHVSKPITKAVLLKVIQDYTPHVPDLLP